MIWKSVRKIILVSLFMLAHSQSHATCNGLFTQLQFKPYAGWEYQYEHVKGNGSWGDLLPANWNSQAFFIGNRYHPNFGIEISYYHTFHKAQGSTFLSAFNGNTASDNTLVVAQIRNEGFAFDWDVYFPLDPKFNIMTTIGLVTYHPNIQIYSDSGTDLAAVLQSVTGKNKTLLRLGIGLEYEERHWGARMRMLWDQTQKMTVNLNGQNGAAVGVTADAFKQACIFTVGLFYIF